MKGYTFEQLQIGQSASYTRQITEEDTRAFAELCGDKNPVHLDEEYAKGTVFKGPVVHGIHTASLISTVLGMHLPGPGSIYAKQDLKFLAPVRFGDTLTATCTVKEKIEGKNRVILDCKITNQGGTDVVVGEAMIIAP
ncbi:MAG: MaoC family dehydratase [Defluviitaleaceae bacterium]|nr:MaoC family dehydratase [Defluviitaleaceae bacterium]MCL2238576.1 MaoC family dehydratase [Defluviitaleaceae bacterium]